RRRAGGIRSRAERDAGQSRARSTRRNDRQTAALPGLPERIDRGFGCRPRPRSARTDPRAPESRRQRRAGDQICYRPLRRFRAAEAAGRACNISAVVLAFRHSGGRRRRGLVLSAPPAGAAGRAARPQSTPPARAAAARRPMIFALVLLFVTLAVLGTVLSPLWQHGRRAMTRGRYDRAVYRDQ